MFLAQALMQVRAHQARQSTSLAQADAHPMPSTNLMTQHLVEGDFETRGGGRFTVLDTDGDPIGDFWCDAIPGLDVIELH